LADITERKIELEYQIKHLKKLQHSIAETRSPFNQIIKTGITSKSPVVQKLTLFRSSFRGRRDVFPRRFESKRTGRDGAAYAIDFSNGITISDEKAFELYVRCVRKRQ